MTKYVKNLERYESYGWEWFFNEDWKFENSDPNWVHYGTNEDGEGLWVEDENGNWKQIARTYQFKLPSNRSGAYKKIVKEFAI